MKRNENVLAFFVSLPRCKNGINVAFPKSVFLFHERRNTTFIFVFQFSSSEGKRNSNSLYALFFRFSLALKNIDLDFRFRMAFEKRI